MTARPALDRRLSVAPMMDWTDRHCRYFHRLLAPRALLYTEMVTTGALLHAGPARFLAHDPAERPLAVQLGGAEPGELAACAATAEAWGFAEVNLNCGCPSDRVQSGRFGACLMAEPLRVAASVAAMRAAAALPVTVKCRIGIDDSDDWGFLARFADAVAAAGAAALIVHARKAWLKGLSPKENRELPPLRYDLVHRLKRERPGLTLVVNGGITSPAAALDHLAWADGVMIGRAAYQDPWCLPAFEAAILGRAAAADRHEILAAMADYAGRQMASGVPLKAVARHLLGLFNGLPGARAWRRRLSQGMADPEAAPGLLLAAARAVGEGRRPPREAVIDPGHGDLPAPAA
jgi:tRNA-dihydrouridine synthase A